MKIADTAAQDVRLQPRSRRGQYVAAGAATVLVVALAWLAAPVVQRWISARSSSNGSASSRASWPWKNARPPTNLRRNQRLTTRILLAEFRDVLMLQRGQFLDSGAGRIAYVIDGDGMAVRRPTAVGARSLL